MKVSLDLIRHSNATYDSAGEPAPEGVDALVAKIGAQLGAVEAVIDLAPKYAGITIVEIVEVAPHPDADKLNIYTMHDGKHEVVVVSGDRTLRVADKVAWIAPGQTVPSTYGTAAPFVIADRDMRGVVSHGMFGSGKELDLNDDHSKVLVLDTDKPAGTLLADAYGLNDTIIDIENKMFTHRPDCFGTLGVAREITVFQCLPFVSPDWDQADIASPKHPDPSLTVTVTNQVPELVPRYMAVAMDGITVAPSPLWLQSRLHRIGIRPINNVVDVTNLMMYITGQPLHAFDFDAVSAGTNHATIVVRKPKKDETLPLLDGKTITPHKDAILIANQHTPIALGGVMGGANSEITAKTTRIIIECANFDMFNIRRTSMHHGIFTDAVTRFSKGQSPAQCAAVLLKTITDMTRLASGSVASAIVDVYPAPATNPTIAVTSDLISDRLGVPLSADAIAVMLNNVEFVVEEHGRELLVTAPFWRTDITIAEDIVEEIGRLHGYDKLPHRLPLRATSATERLPLETLKDRITDVLASAGANQLQTYSFVPAKLLRSVGQNPKLAYALRNALSPELEHFRLSLTPSLLEKVHPNSKAGYDTFTLFELGKTHLKAELDLEGLPKEHHVLGLVYANTTPQPGAAFYQAATYLSHVLHTLHVPYSITPFIGSSQFAQPFEPKRAGAITINGQVAGIIGEYRAAVTKQLKLPAYAAGFELDLEQVVMAMRPLHYQPLLRFPATEQDVSLRVASDVPYAAVYHAVRQGFVADGRLRITLAPLDIYQPADSTTHKHVTLRITLQHHDRTLITDEVNQLLDDMVKKVDAALGATRN